MLAFLVIALAHALLENLPIMRRWIDRPYLFLFPTLGAGAALVLAASILHHDDDLPFYAVALIFASRLELWRSRSGLLS
jgi:cytochrome bd ubiquinol oxidase subunit II